MYESYTRQALPEKNYRELLGSAICVFNSNNAFVIENILNTTGGEKYSWHKLVDHTSGGLKEEVLKTITAASNADIADLFDKIVEKRNRIVHSFQITDTGNNEQILATKDKDNIQFQISRCYLLEFIKDNNRLSSLLHDYRGF